MFHFVLIAETTHLNVRRYTYNFEIRIIHFKGSPVAMMIVQRTFGWFKVI